jgi:hypothetical protein
VIGQHFGSRRRIRRWRRRLSIYSSSYTIENLELELSNGRRLRLVLKDLSPAALLSTARQIRPHFLYAPLREIETYRKTLPPLDLGTPVCYGATILAKQERYWLFLERVPGPMLWQMGRMESWNQAARWLARLHNSFGTVNGGPVPPCLAHLTRYDSSFYQTWLHRADEFLRRKYSGNGHSARRRFARLANRYDRVVKILAGLPTTFIHGEFYPSNVIMRHSGRGREICPVDWELAAIAPGLIDLAALTSGDWSEERRNLMIASYRDALEPANGELPSMRDLIEAVDCCQLHISMQLLGWASDWSPPRRHAQNWLREAVRIGRRLGL